MNGHFERGVLAFNMQRWELARRELFDSLEAESENARIWSLIASCSYNLKDYDAAIEQSRKALTLNPYSHYSMQVISLAYLQKHQYFEAEIAIEDALAISPNDADYLCSYAAIEMAMSQKDKALSMVDRALEIDPVHEGALRQRYHVLLSSGKSAEAESMRLRLLELYPDDALIHAASGWKMLNDEGQSAKAIDHFSNALRLDPNAQKNVDGLLEAQYRQWLNDGPLSFKRNKWLLTLIPVLTIVAMAFVVLFLRLNLPGQWVVWLIFLTPISLLFFFFGAQIPSRLIFFAIKLSEKKLHPVLLKRTKEKLSSWLLGAGIGLLILGWQFCVPLAHQPCMHWLYDDWLTMYDWRAAWLAPFLFCFCIFKLVKASLLIIRSVMAHRSMTTIYLQNLYTVFAASAALSVFFYLACCGPNAALPWIILPLQLFLIVLPQSALYKNLLKQIVRKEQERLNAGF